MILLFDLRSKKARTICPSEKTAEKKRLMCRGTTETSILNSQMNDRKNSHAPVRVLRTGA